MNPHLPEGRRVMDKRQHHVIFSNVREVREVSARFLEELQSRQRESAVVRNISDIVLNYVSVCVWFVCMCQKTHGVYSCNTHVHVTHVYYTSWY